MDAKIRKVLLKDRDEIISIVNKNQNFTSEEKECARELLDIYLKDPKQKDYDLFCAVDSSDRLIGYVCYGRTPLTEGTYDLYWIVVEPLYHGRGIGKMLVNHLENMLKGMGARMLLAETSSRTDYGAVIIFYEKNGFKEAARIKDFYRTNDDKIIYRKDIVKWGGA